MRAKTFCILASSLRTDPCPPPPWCDEAGGLLREKDTLRGIWSWELAADWWYTLAGLCPLYDYLICLGDRTLCGKVELRWSQRESILVHYIWALTVCEMTPEDGCQEEFSQGQLWSKKVMDDGGLIWQEDSCKTLSETEQNQRFSSISCTIVAAAQDKLKIKNPRWHRGWNEHVLIIAFHVAIISIGLVKKFTEVFP